MKSRGFLSSISIVSLCLVPGVALGQKTVDLPTALELARRNNPDWRAAEQEVEVTRGKLTTARLLTPFNPVIESQAGRRTIPGEGKGTDYSVGLSMELEVAGQRGVRITEAERDLQRAEASFKDFERTFRGKLAKTFYQAVFARERLGLLRRVETLNRQLSEVTKIKFDAGDVSGLEVSVAQVRYGRSRKETFDAERNLTQALLDLKRLIGVDETFLPSGSLGVVATPVPLREVLEQALRNRPDLLTKKYELQRAEAEIGLRRREVFPNPSLSVSFNREGSGDRTVLGGISIPLPILNRRQGELQSLGARNVQARAELLALEKEIRKEVDQAISQWEVALRNTDLFKREVIEQTEENFRLLEAAYRERKIDLPQLLIMENDLISANQDYLDVLLELQQAAIALREVTGVEH